MCTCTGDEHVYPFEFPWIGIKPRAHWSRYTRSADRHYPITRWFGSAKGLRAAVCARLSSTKRIGGRVSVLSLGCGYYSSLLFLFLQQGCNSLRNWARILGWSLLVVCIIIGDFVREEINEKKSRWMNWRSEDFSSVMVRNWYEILRKRNISKKMEPRFDQHRSSN